MPTAPAIRLKRVYEPAEASDGTRLLVDGLWPRGLSKDQLAIHTWHRAVAPSAQLRRWFAHTEERWDEFCLRYFAELDAKPEAWRPLLDTMAAGAMTFVYAARDERHNNAVALRLYLLARRSTPARSE